MKTKKTKMLDATVEKLIDYILANRLQEGDRLPNEQALAASLDIGRSTVREAMKILASRRIVEIRQGSGTYVAGATGMTDDPLGLTFIDDKMKLMTDLTAIRVLIEPSIAAMAAENADADDIKRIRGLHAEVNKLIAAGRNHREKDVALHTAIAMSSKNIVVPRLIPIIHSTISMFIDATNLALTEETRKVHGWIVDAIADHDPTAAREAMLVHLILNRRLIDATQKDSPDGAGVATVNLNLSPDLSLLTAKKGGQGKTSRPQQRSKK